MLAEREENRGKRRNKKPFTPFREHKETEIGLQNALAHIHFTLNYLGYILESGFRQETSQVPELPTDTH